LHGFEGLQAVVRAVLTLAPHEHPCHTTRQPNHHLLPPSQTKAVLTDALGGRALDRHLDADEAVVLGGALFAANLSTSFRLRK
jgi:hypothetical protein